MKLIKTARTVDAMKMIKTIKAMKAFYQAKRSIGFTERSDSSRPGFTLLELLVVVAIIGLMASLVIATLSTARARSRDARRAADIKSIENALNLYVTNTRVFPATAGVWVCLGSTDDTTVTSVLVPASMPVMPKDPQQPSPCPNGSATPLTSATHYYRYQSPVGGATYTIQYWLETNNVSGKLQGLNQATP